MYNNYYFFFYYGRDSENDHNARASEIISFAHGFFLWYHVFAFRHHNKGRKGDLFGNMQKCGL